MPAWSFGKCVYNTLEHDHIVNHVLSTNNFSVSITNFFRHGLWQMKTKGLCNTDTKAGIFRKKSNSSRSRLSISPSQYKSSSCPSSPRQGALRLNNSTSSLSQYELNAASTSTAVLHRSASTMSAFRPRSSPSGLFSYTGKWYHLFLLLRNEKSDEYWNFFFFLLNGFK